MICKLCNSGIDQLYAEFYGCACKQDIPILIVYCNYKKDNEWIDTLSIFKTNYFIFKKSHKIYKKRDDGVFNTELEDEGLTEDMVDEELSSKFNFEEDLIESLHLFQEEYDRYYDNLEFL